MRGGDIVFDRDNYITKEFTVDCVTGVQASSVNGKLIIPPIESISGENSLRSLKRTKVHAVKKKTKEPYYVRVFSAGEGYIEMVVVAADFLCRKGLNWHSIYIATIEFKRFTIRERGEKTLEYWLNKDLDDTLLVPKPGHEPPSGSSLGERLGITDFNLFYGEETSIKDIFKAYESGKFYGTMGLCGGDLKELQFGVEIEFTGMTRKVAAEYLAEFFGTGVTKPRYSSYDRYTVVDRSGRIWSIKNDSSISAPVDWYNKPAGAEFKCELETPILEYGDIELLQNLVRGLRRDRYMRVNSSCGIHVHVGGTFGSVAVKNAYNLIASNQKLLSRALKVRKSGLNHYCHFVSGNAYKDYTNKTMDKQAVSDGWRKAEDTRYRFLNVKSYIDGKGLEFRFFNSTTHAGKLKAYIQFSLAVCNYARTVSNVNPKEKELGHDLNKMRSLLYKIGLRGDEFKTCRFHFTSNLKNEESSTSNRRVA